MLAAEIKTTIFFAKASVIFLKENEMTLKEAIKHLKEMLNSHDFGCAECRAEHEQLLAWLQELSERRRNDQTQNKITRPKPWGIRVK